MFHSKNHTFNCQNKKFKQLLYIVTDKYHSSTETNTLTVKVFLKAEKSTPLIIVFLTIDHYYMGQVLKSGINLINNLTNTSDNVNINQPQFIRKLILQGRKNGWTGNNKLEKQNGLIYLNELGYETDILTPKFIKQKNE